MDQLLHPAAQPSAPEARRTAPAREAEGGFMLIAVVVMVALVLIALSVAAPVIAKDVRRDKEVEAEQRAQQYVRAIRVYYRKFHNYPPSIDALKQSNNIRFLRQEYTDPLTGKADWKLLHLGEQKTTVKVFFGQDLGEIGGSGSTGPGLGTAAGMSSGFGTSASGAAGSGTGIGSSLGGTSSSTSTISGGSPLTSGFNGASITTSGTAGASGATGSTGSTGGLGGGGIIIGVSPGATGDSILTPNQQKTYESWEFWYDPRIEQLYQKGKMNMGIGGGSLGSQPASGFGTGLNGQPNGTSGVNGIGSSVLNGGSTTGSGTSTPTTPTTPTSPQ